MGWLVLVVSALAVHRVPMARGLRMFAVWALIFVAVFAAFALREDFASLGRHVLMEARGGAVEEGETIRIRQSADGHFWADGTINGAPVRFLIDSGATTTSISAETARRAGIEGGGAFPAMVQTANGRVAVERARAEEIRIGPIVREDVAVHVSPAFAGMNVLGMNYLSSLSGWGVEGKWLLLRP
ncbi:MAG: TIGR02281 family clan AA aspartic protease [Sphingomonadaceae bacterium]